MPETIPISTDITSIIIAVILGYFLGSLPFGLIVTRLGGEGDVREIGSGNIGATNVLRTGRKSLAALTLLGDLLKGTAAVLIAHWILPGTEIPAGLAAFIGHLFPVWLKFQGGKGVATYIGVLLGLYWPSAVAFCVLWLGVAAISRYSSMAGLMASLATPFALIGFGQWQLSVAAAFMSVLLWAKHIPNIQRLVSGQETKIGQGK